MKLYSNEIVFRGHPDKVCDQISDAILDECLKQDKNSRCGIEVVGGKGKIFITGEVTTNVKFDVENIAKRVLLDVGYPTDFEITDNIGKQSADIALGTNDDIGGAGDNGMMFGFATRETKEYLPKAMVILQRLAKAYDEIRKTDQRFLPDGKAQITGVYNDKNELIEIKYFTICYQNTEKERHKTDELIKLMCDEICAEFGVEVKNYLINPTGRFKIGGFEGDAGLTGRKIVVDNYHSFVNVGGGAFSGKDPTKVDRSGAYKAREIAKKVLNSNEEISWCKVQLSYAIGLKNPLAIYIKTNLGNIDISEKLYDECSVKNIINDLDLLNINYEEKSRFGHFTD